MSALESWPYGPFTLVRQPDSLQVAICENGVFLRLAVDAEAAEGIARFWIAQRECAVQHTDTPPQAA